MIREMHDDDGRVNHGKFQSWRRTTPEGVFATFVGKRKVNIHGARCSHLGSTDWAANDDGENSLTRKRKVVADSQKEIARWARQKGLSVHACIHCVRDGFVMILELQATSVHEPATTGAMEGLSKEITVLSQQRNASLRIGALAKANGTCEACKVNFGAVLNGAGLSVLQVHHRNQLSLSRIPRLTRVEELAVLCANCHALVHSDRKNAIPVERLRAWFSSSNGAA